MYSSFFEEMVKIAYDEADADKVLRLAKAKQTPKASYKALPKQLHNTGMLAVAPPASSDKELFERNIKSLPYPYRQEAEAEGRPVFEHVLRVQKRIPGKIIPGKKSLNKLLFTGNLSGGPDVPDSQKKMFHSILKGHELDEVGSPPGHESARMFGHRSPSVIFKEHNRVTTLPPGFKETADKIRSVRAGAEGHQFMDRFGLKYGTSPRLSRHAIKRLTEHLENEHRANYSAAMEDLHREADAMHEEALKDNELKTRIRDATHERALRLNDRITKFRAAKQKTAYDQDAADEARVFRASPALRKIS